MLFFLPSFSLADPVLAGASLALSICVSKAAPPPHWWAAMFRYCVSPKQLLPHHTQKTPLQKDSCSGRESVPTHRHAVSSCGLPSSHSLHGLATPATVLAPVTAQSQQDCACSPTGNIPGAPVSIMTRRDNAAGLHRAPSTYSHCFQNQKA